jgi:hypothetical protein
MDFRSELSAMPAGVVPSPWNGFENVHGGGVFGAPFSSGHVLALRICLEEPARSVPYRRPSRRPPFVGGLATAGESPLAEAARNFAYI